jgi:hypothetical protein
MPDAAGGSHPDPDEFDRELRKLTEEIGKSRIREPSALERLVAAKEAEKRAQRKRDSRVLALLLVVAVLIAGGGVFTWLRFAPPSWLHHKAAAHAAPSARTVPSSQPTLKALATPLSPVTANGPPADPFAGSPSAGWPAGAAGIAVPAARAHGRYTAAQVRSAYDTTRKLLIAGNLDWPTLRGGAPTAFADLLTAQQRKQFLGGLRTTALDKHGDEENTRTWVTSFAPGSTKFVTTIIKVNGTMSAGTATVSGTEVLRIKIDFLFVYAVEPPGKPADWMRVVQQRYGDVDFAQWDDPGGRLEPWDSTEGGAAGGQCDARDGYIHPDYAQGPPDSVKASGAPQDPYSMATPSSAGANTGCRATTGT